MPPLSLGPAAWHRRGILVPVAPVLMSQQLAEVQAINPARQEGHWMKKSASLFIGGLPMSWPSLMPG
jgi:hypothetical protein